MRIIIDTQEEKDALIAESLYLYAWKLHRDKEAKESPVALPNRYSSPDMGKCWTLLHLHHNPDLIVVQKQYTEEEKAKIMAEEHPFIQALFRRLPEDANI